MLVQQFVHKFIYFAFLDLQHKEKNTLIVTINRMIPAPKYDIKNKIITKRINTEPNTIRPSGITINETKTISKGIEKGKKK